jgi:hypothetical protein
MIELQLIDPDASIDIPADVAVCPYCGAALVARFTAWTEEDDGTWAASEVTVDCVSEPAIDGGNWESWYWQHSYMPYVYQLPVDMKVLEWINKTYRFKISQEVQP